VRIRQVRPEFFTDAVTAKLTPSVQITYIGLWCISDDGGWLAWDVRQIGALLYPYKSVRARERTVSDAGSALSEAGRLILYPCGCAYIPKLADHQRIGGTKSFTARDKHRVHTNMDLSARNVTLGNVTLVAREDGRPLREKVDLAPQVAERIGLPVSK
jgi:hypothetical protein